MNPAKRLLLPALAALAGCWLPLQAQIQAPPAPGGAVVEAAALDDAIHRTLGYLTRANLPNGEFIYLANSDPRHPSPLQYNAVRHAAALYVLGLYLRRADDAPALAALQRAGRFLSDCCIATPPERPDLLAVWSQPELDRTRAPLEANLGGTGLALVGLAELERLQPGAVSIAGLRRLGEFLLFMQKDDGSFHAKFTPGQGGRRDTRHALYYPGEAILGLLALHRLDPDPRWYAAAARAMAWLAEQPVESEDWPPDHWTLIATARLLAAEPAGEPPLPRERLVRHSTEIARALLARYREPADPVLRGSIREDGVTTSTATTLEGLLAAMDFLPRSEGELRNRIMDFAADGIDFLLRAQIRSGPFDGGIPFAIRPLPDDGEGGANRAFNRYVTEIRIDYVQHALGAMLAYANLTRAGAP